MALSTESFIAVSHNLSKPISGFRQGDPIWVAKDADLSSWIQKPVQFIDREKPKKYQEVVYLSFSNPSGSGDISTLIVDPEQLLLVSDRKLKVASDLSFHDALLAFDGSHCSLVSVTMGSSTADLYNIAADMRVSSSLAGHLLLANGIVIADYSLHLFRNEFAR